MKRKLMLILLILSFFCNMGSSNTVTVRTIKVLVIEIDPLLRIQQGLRASRHISLNPEVEVDNLVNDIKYVSHGNVNVRIVKKEHFDGFPKFTQHITVKGGAIRDRLDENTWLDIMKDGWGKHEESPYYKALPPNIYDYEEVIQRFDLINRRNKGEFDEVWLVSVAPIQAYDSVMVGSKAYKLDGPPIIKNCKNFRILHISMGKPEANLERFGKAAEIILSNVFGSRFDPNKQNSYTVRDIDDLNPWERFTLNNYATPGYAAVGTILFAPNSVRERDWQNTSTIQSSWRDWQNYPEFSGKTQDSNYLDWVPATNQMPVARQHHRWWFSLIPHVEGRTKDGFSNNWWDYLYMGDYVTDISPSWRGVQEYQIDDQIKLEFDLLYVSGTKEILRVARVEDYDTHITITDTNVVRLKNKRLTAHNVGTAVVTVMYDGKKASYEISVSEKDENPNENSNTNTNDEEKQNNTSNEAAETRKGIDWNTIVLQMSMGLGVVFFGIMVYSIFKKGKDKEEDMKYK